MDDPFSDLKKSQRDRIWHAIDHACKTDRLNRNVIMEYGEVTAAQASYDISLILVRMPGFLKYNRGSKTYVRIKE